MRLRNRTHRWLVLAAVITTFAVGSALAAEKTTREFNGPYSGKNLDRIAFPIGGMGAGMYCLEGTGCLHVPHATFLSWNRD